MNKKHKIGIQRPKAAVFGLDHSSILGVAKNCAWHTGSNSKNCLLIELIHDWWTENCVKMIPSDSDFSISVVDFSFFIYILFEAIFGNEG